MSTRGKGRLTYACIYFTVKKLWLSFGCHFRSARMLISGTSKRSYPMARTLTVTTTNNTSPGQAPVGNFLSLRQALELNASDGGGDTILFSPSLAGRTISYSSFSGGLTIGNNVLIDGQTNGIIIDALNSVTPFTVTGGTVEIDNLTIFHGNATGSSGFSTTPNGSSAAGGLFVRSGNVTLKGDRFVNNTAVGGDGGAFFGGNGGNAAGAVLVQSGSITLANDTFTGNTATGGSGNTNVTGGPPGTGGGAAGAVYIEPGATVVSATNLQVSGSTAVGGPGGPSFVGPGGPPGAAYSVSNNATINSAVVCFATGTGIATAQGEVAVERLRVGDAALTVSGAVRPIRWLGCRALEGQGRGPLAFEQWPVRVRAGAFGEGLPRRDLLLSPGHPVLVGEGEGRVLVPIMCLINGTTVERVSVDAVTYWHVELDGHDILLAEGLPAESYIDLGSRPWFDAGSSDVLHDPDFVPAGRSGRCLPVALDGPVVDAERRRLDAVFASQLAGQCRWPDAADPLRFEHL